MALPQCVLAKNFRSLGLKHLVLILFLLITSTNVFGAKETPKSVVEKIFNQAKNPKIAKDKTLQEKLNACISFAEMAKSSLGKYVKSLTKDQFSWFQSTLKEIITETVYPEAPDFFKNVKVEYEDEEVGKARAEILSVVIEKGEETEVAYTLKLMQGKWKVVDVALDDESWIESIYEEVDEVMKKDKWKGLKSKLSKRLKEVRESNKKPKSKKS